MLLALRIVTLAPLRPFLKTILRACLRYFLVVLTRFLVATFLVAFLVTFLVACLTFFVCLVVAVTELDEAATADELERVGVVTTGLVVVVCDEATELAVVPLAAVAWLPAAFAVVANMPPSVKTATNPKT
ncbi:hypothetical protein DXH47_05770 [Levilactobacillus suantsaii]|uniref:Uncharacterized protein n=1 Tax=Levilactobacillus suantsaii TaxID=2292255 RepID=A0A4Q0VI46_9LACO|nr:hypothetical protein DXH47_05770 [Levilactobacillus suantsaii]